MPVDSTHSQYTKNATKWETMRDCIAGQDEVIARRTAHLPEFIPVDSVRYDQYLQRALYTNVTGRTLKGLVGAIFRRPPVEKMNMQIDYLREDYDGSGQSLTQLGKLVCSELITTGRYGLLVDYPKAPPGLSQEQVKNLQLRAIIAAYPAESIINWKAFAVGGSLVTVLVVLKEVVDEQVDEFDVKSCTHHRVLMLDESGLYLQRVFNEKNEQVGDDIFPTDSAGYRLKEIPFQFVGAEDNRPEVDDPPLYDLAMVNLAHYRNSADYEEGVFVHGQGTLFVSSDMSVDQWKEANPNGIVVGSRRGHFLGANGSASLLQMDANGAAREAMTDKIETMKMIGARLISSRTGTQTAEAARIDAGAESSVLNTIVGNASEAIKSALKYACLFMGGDPAKVHYTLNKDFFDSTMTAQDVMAMIQLEDRGTIAKADTRAKLRATNWIGADRTDEMLDAEAEGNGMNLPPMPFVPPKPKTKTIVKNADNSFSMTEA